MSDTDSALVLPIDAFRAPANSANAIREISHAIVMAAGGYPFHITEPGDYLLTSDLMPYRTDGIIVCAQNVLIDLNGHFIVGNRLGIGIASTKPDCAVVNGTIMEMMYGILLLNNSRVERVRVISNSFMGIGLSANAVISHCTIANNGKQGINVTGPGASIIGNHISANGHFGVMMRGGLLHRNMITQHRDVGFYTEAPEATDCSGNVVCQNEVSFQPNLRFPRNNFGTEHHRSAPAQRVVAGL